MASKTLIKKCKCIHCQKKLDQINQAKYYWEKIKLNDF